MESKLISCLNIKKYYLLYDDGSIYSLKSNRFLKQHSDKDGYLKVTLMRQDGTWSPFSIHRLMAIMFITNSQGKTEVNHKDSDRTNNNLSNLEWVTYEENQKHGCLYGNKSTGWRKLSPSNVRRIRDSKISNRKLADHYGVDQRVIHNVRKNITYKWVV